MVGSSSLSLSRARRRRVNRSHASYFPRSLRTSIIDYLQQWTLKKRAERILKMAVRCQRSDGFSAIPPAAYGRRFRERIVEGAIEPSDVDTSQWERHREYRHSVVGLHDLSRSKAPSSVASGSLSSRVVSPPEMPASFAAPGSESEKGAS